MSTTDRTDRRHLRAVSPDEHLPDDHRPGDPRDDAGILGEIAADLLASANRLSADSPWRPRIVAFARLLDATSGLKAARFDLVDGGH